MIVCVQILADMAPHGII